MYFHREGRKIIAITLVSVLAIFAAMALTVRTWTWVHFLFIIILIGLAFWIIRFFRIPRRIFTESTSQLIAPADGTIVTIEETYEKEYIKDDCIQISIFMSANDVHVNRYPCDGVVEYVKYSRGNYFVASYPKSSDLNERSSVGIRLENGNKILVRQVAGAMARRIVCYAKEGQTVKQNQELGFIRFGSRVDVFVPKSFTIDVDIENRVKNAITPICSFGK